MGKGTGKGSVCARARVCVCVCAVEKVTWNTISVTSTRISKVRAQNTEVDAHYSRFNSWVINDTSLRLYVKNYENMVSSDFWTLSPTSGLYPIWDSSPPPAVAEAQFISAHPQEMPVHDFWKGQNCQVAAKCTDICNCINTKTVKLIIKLTTPSLYQKSLIKNNLVNKRKFVYWFNDSIKNKKMLSYC